MTSLNSFLKMASRSRALVTSLYAFAFEEIEGWVEMDGWRWMDGWMDG